MPSFSAITPHSMKSANMIATFRLIKEKAGISRARISERTGLSPSTISLITEALIEKELVAECPGDCASPRTVHRVGRRPVGLCPNTRDFFIITVAVQRSGFSGMIQDLAGGRVFAHAENTPVEGERLAGQLVSFIRRMVLASGETGKHFLGIGIGIAGLVETRNGYRVTSPKFGLYRVQIHHIIAETFGLPVYLGNDAIFAGSIEKQAYPEPVQSFVYIYINNGIGSSVIIHNQQVWGPVGADAGLGHMSVDFHGEHCPCGNRGCLELYASVNAIIRRVTACIGQGEKSLATALAGGRDIDEHIVCEAARRGDALANRVIDEAAQRFSHALTTVLNMYSPEAIVVGGRIKAFGDLFLPRAAEAALRTALEPLRENVKIQYSRFDDTLILDGAAAYVLERRLSDLVLDDNYQGRKIVL